LGRILETAEEKQIVVRKKREVQSPIRKEVKGA